MVVEVDVCVVECVNILSPSGRHRHCPGMAFVQDAIGAVTHHVRWPSDRSLHRPWLGEEMWGVSVSRNGSIGPCYCWLPRILCGTNRGESGMGNHVPSKKQERDRNGSGPTRTGSETIELISCSFLRLPIFSRHNPVIDPVFWGLGKSGLGPTTNYLGSQPEPKLYTKCVWGTSLSKQVVLLPIAFESY
jgi:hypothetical protein